MDVPALHFLDGDYVMPEISTRHNENTAASLNYDTVRPVERAREDPMSMSRGQ